MLPRPLRRPGARPAVVVPAAAVLALVAGCSSTVPTTAGPDATDPVCAEVVLALPDDLGDGLVQQRTDAQATTAWGDPRSAVVLRCGVEPLGPTTDRCVTLETPDGGSVDWVVVEHDDGAWTFTTYGRVPAVEVDVPAAVADERSTSFVVDLGPAVGRTAVERSCV